MLVAAPDTQKDDDPSRRRGDTEADSEARGSADEAVGPSADGGFRLFDSNPVSDSEYDSDGGRNNAPAVSPPLGRPIKASGSRDNQLIPASNSKERVAESRPGHEPQTEASLSNFQAVLIDKIRGDKERENDQEEEQTESAASSFASSFAASADRFKWFK